MLSQKLARRVGLAGRWSLRPILKGHLARICEHILFWQGYALFALTHLVRPPRQDYNRMARSCCMYMVTP